MLITDIRMPNGDGYDLIEKVHALGERQGFRLPIAAFSGFGDDREIQRIDAAGFNAFISKPPKLEDVVLSIRKILDGGQLNVP